MIWTFKRTAFIICFSLISMLITVHCFCVWNTWWIFFKILWFFFDSGSFEIFCNIMDVFTVTFDQLNASLRWPNRLNSSVYSELIKPVYNAWAGKGVRGIWSGIVWQNETDWIAIFTLFIPHIGSAYLAPALLWAKALSFWRPTIDCGSIRTPLRDIKTNSVK